MNYNMWLAKVLSTKSRDYLEWCPCTTPVSRNKKGAYIPCKLDGLVLQNPIAQFRVLPYFARKSIFLPEGFIDIGADRLREMEEQDFEEGEEDLLDLPYENELKDN